MHGQSWIGGLIRNRQLATDGFSSSFCTLLRSTPTSAASNQANPMPTHKARFSIAQLLLLTTGVAVFCVVLMNENQWLRATYVTISLGVVLNALIAAIFARGERQAFSLGFIVGCVFCGLAAPYATGFTLPYLLSMELLKWIRGFVSVPPTEMHFWIVVGIFWAMLTASCSGLIAQRWYCSAQASRQQAQAREANPVGPAG